MSEPLTGDKTSGDLKNGPVQDRSCTDIICLIFFVAFSIGMTVIAGVGLSQGQPSRLAQPYDPDHHACGVDPVVADYPFIYFANPTNPRYLYVTTCVKVCPSKNQGSQPDTTSSSSSSADTTSLDTSKEDRHSVLDYYDEHNRYQHDEDESLQCATNSIVTSCKSNHDMAHPGSVVIIYNSLPYMNRVCLPVAKDYFSMISSEVNPQAMEQAFQDVKTTKWVIALSILVAIVVSFLFIYFLEKCAGVVVWLFIFATLALLFTSGLMSYFYYLALTNPDALPAAAKSHLNVEQMQHNAYADNVDANTYKYIAITFWVFAGVFFLMLICFYSRIKLGIAILKTAGDFVQDNPIILFLPLLTMMMLLTYFVIWTTIAVYLYSTGQVSTKPHGLPFGQFQFTTDQKIMANYHLFGLFWNLAFIIASVEFIIAGAVCNWYFKQGPDGQDTGNSTMGSIRRYFKYHLGTVAVGSFLLAVVNFIRFWLEYLYHNSEELRKKNKVLEILMDCLRCCLWYFEKVVQYINKNAYINTNMTGNSFFKAAGEAVSLILRNPLRFATVGGLGEVFIAIGRLFVAALTGLMCYLIITKDSHFQGQVQYPYVPALLCASVGFVIGSNFMAIYGIACDAILFVFCMDEEMEKAGHKKGQCPPRLRKFLDDN